MIKDKSNRQTTKWRLISKMPDDSVLRIGTRASPLARAQAQSVVKALCAAHGLSAAQIKVCPITTRGDKILDKPLAEIGGKGLFTEELSRALYDGTLDIAVHSLKDLPTAPQNDTEQALTLAAILPRATAADVLIVKDAQNQPALDAQNPSAHDAQNPSALDAQNPLSALVQGARLGTASLRRQAQILHVRPDIEISMVRGNIGTRLQKLRDDEMLIGIILAQAGLERLALASGENLQDGLQMVVLPPSLMLPAAAQGALAVQCRADNTAILGVCAPLHCAPTALCVAAERAFLAALDGSCRTPIAALAQLRPDGLHLRGRLLANDGTDMVAGDMLASDIAKPIDAIDKATSLGQALAQDLRARAPHL